MLEGVDCASVITNPTALKAAGKHFAVRYLSTAGNPKNLTAAEARGLHAAGMDVAMVFETSGTDMRGATARSNGIADATSAAQQAKALGAPSSAALYFAVDFDAQPADMPAVLAYFSGAVAAVGHDRVGGYGSIRVVKALLDGKVCKYGWQTYAWSEGAWDARAQLRQYENGVSVAGMKVDLDHSTAPDYGQWAAAVKPPPPPPRPKAWTMKHHNKAGVIVERPTKHPVLYQMAHRGAKYRGRITITPIE